MAAAAAGAGSRAAAAGEAADSASPAGCRKAPCCWRCSKLSSPPWSPAAGRVGGGGGGGARRHHQRRAARGEEGAAAPPRPRSSGAAAASACIPPRALEGRLSRDCLRPRRPACSQRSRSYLAPERTLEKEPVSLGPEHPAEDCGQAKEEGLLSVFSAGSPLRHSRRRSPTARPRRKLARESLSVSAFPRLLQPSAYAIRKGVLGDRGWT